jgi:hypothetical protein
MTPKMEWQLVRDGKAWQGTLTLPIMDAGQLGPEPSGKVMKVKGKKAPSKQKALENVGKTALKALENPIVQSILPPGAGAAIQAVKALASPKVARAVARHGKKALRAVARVFR